VFKTFIAKTITVLQAILYEELRWGIIIMLVGIMTGSRFGYCSSKG
jgi:hypothetical protein